MTTYSPFSCALDAWLAREAGANAPEDLCMCVQRAQYQALSATLARALRKSRFYARNLGPVRKTIETQEELAELPFTQATDLNPWEDLLCVSAGEVERFVTIQTSGTTGIPKRLAFTAHDLRRTRDFFAVGLSVLLKPGATLAVLMPGGNRPDGVTDLLRQAWEPLGTKVVWPEPALLADPSLSAVRDWLKETRAHVLVAMPSQLVRLALLLPHGLPGLTGVLASAERLDNTLASALHAQWHCCVLNHYGLTETGYGCAVECPAHDGLHIRALDVIIEIVDFETEEPVPMGTIGEVVITTLNREAMPLIRYRTGDVASLLPGPCACGSPLPRLGPILGRLRKTSGSIHILTPAKGAYASASRT